MSINEKAVAKIAHLARLNISPERIPEVHDRLNHILKWIEQLNEVETSHIDPLFSVHLKEMPQRPDAVTDGQCADAILANAPEKDLDMFVVPKVVE
jgi:aspartyl-tRNA(Asn)/glutamyl-tRNA(Gln) amidotransferase subunit C